MRTPTKNCRSDDITIGRRRCHDVAIALLAGLAIWVGGLQPASAESFLEITPTENGFTIDAEEVSINKILQELARVANFEIVDATGTSETLAVFTAEDQPLPAALKSLLAKQNHLIVYGASKDPAQPEKVTKVILMRPNAEPKPAQKRNANVSPLAGPGAKPTPRPGRASAAAGFAAREGAPDSGSDAPSAGNPEDFMDAEEEFDRLLDTLDPEDADEIREAIQAEFLRNSE